MQSLKDSMNTKEFCKFREDGYFTIRRSNKFWSRIWSDMTIEQTLMRSMKSSGRLTHSRGICESVLSTWILGMPASHDVFEATDQFSGVNFVNTEQHVDARDSQITRDDDDDVCKMCKWFQDHHPFPYMQQLMSIATGVTGNDIITCHYTLNVGIFAMKEIVGSNLNGVKLKRCDKVVPLLNVNNYLKIHDSIVPVDSLLLFRRISVLKKCEEELCEYLRYKLAPFPLSMFDEAGMQKTKKSALYDIFETTAYCCYIIDCGFLLHRCVWQKNQTYDSLCALYINYVRNHFGSDAVILFDGYEEALTDTKAVERFNFLTNRNHKSRLIAMLKTKFEQEHLITFQAPGDADVLIVKTVICMSLEKMAVIIGEDLDLLVLLVNMAPTSKCIAFMKPKKDRTETKIYSLESMSKFFKCKKHILYLHAMTGCDTTSALFSKGKIEAVQLLNKRPNLWTDASMFKEPNTPKDVVERYGESFLLALHGAPIT
ncbi:hypothetical protein PR048_013609 [Dryococelus australis]|uniref:Uncharacterized protein n=1 Tax=Dryococelus australis TaxID=614101 RepID=A0ABQ9HTH7_9NEOP|nr:hypothetical protein PR048_013609 [Dryococelus australis]